MDRGRPCHLNSFAESSTAITNKVDKNVKMMVTKMYMNNDDKR